MSLAILKPIFFSAALAHFATENGRISHALADPAIRRGRKKTRFFVHDCKEYSSCAVQWTHCVCEGF